MNPIQNGLQNYNQINLADISTSGRNQGTDVKLGGNVPSKATPSGNIGHSSNSAGAKNFIIPLGERVEQLGKTFDDKMLKQIGAVECSTCATRTYQDSSNDPGVSFKAPTHLSPSQAAGAVMSHEQEHVVNEQANAKAEGREVISQSVQIFNSICPECGKSYVSGGLTKTTTVGASKPYSQINSGNSSGNLVDIEL